MAESTVCRTLQHSLLILKNENSRLALDLEGMGDVAKLQTCLTSKIPSQVEMYY